MAARDIADTTKQIVRSFGANRRHCMPFVMHLCNLESSVGKQVAIFLERYLKYFCVCIEQGLLWKYLLREMPNLGTLEQPIQVHEGDYCDLFPKEKIVLLTNQSPNILKEYDPTKHYVLGGFINRTSASPYLMSKAKRLQLETARIPIDLYRTLQRNYNTLPLNQLVQVLLEVKYSGDWNKAFDYVARRFVK